jgi:DNA/RNA-binding domain of Phe-tRNA-synthetase-like protein
MYFCHAKEIWQQFPQLVPGVLVVDDLHPNATVEARVQVLFQRAGERLNQGPESGMTEIAAWRRAYAQMGMKPTKYRSAGEALLRRFKREKDLPRVHPLIDLCNAVSLAFALPVAVFDLAKVSRYLEVRYANGDEQYLAFSGEVETIPSGEVIFADAANQAHARRWTFRQSRRSTVGSETRRALIVTEGLHDTADKDIRALLVSLDEAISDLWTPPSEHLVLTADAPRLVFA